MPSVRSLLRVLLALPDIGQRTAWLRSELTSMKLDETACLLEGLCRQSAALDPQAREAMLVVAAVLASLGEHAWVAELRGIAQAGKHRALERLLGPGSWTAPEQTPVEDLPVPDYGKGRELTLGERRSLARRPTRGAFDKLLGDPHPLVIRQLLGNPLLTEDDVVRLATRRPAQSAVMQELADSPRWLCRVRVRMSILLNPGAPPSLVLPLLSVCSRPELREIVRSTQVTSEIRATAEQYLRVPSDEHQPQGA